MNFVLVRPNDDKDIVELLAVQHPRKTLAMFQRNCLAKAKKENPTEWNVDEVFNTLELEGGWSIMKLNTMTVEY
jgi:hypothetical protein